MILDKKKPYSSLSGATHDGARFAQDGVRYKADMTPILTPSQVKTKEKIKAEEKADDNKAAVVSAAVLEVVRPVEVVTEKTEPDYDDMHHMIIKKLAKERGKVFDPFDREEAIAFLKAGD